SYDQGSDAGSYTARAGETLGSAAQALWGDASLWYKLAQANGLGADAALATGQVLSVPPGVTRSRYAADTAAPFDPADTLGDLSPVAPTPTAKAKGKKNKCGTFGKILLVVVAVAVTVATAGTIGVVPAAMLGNAVSQGVGLATGIQDKFSFKSVAIAGLTAGVTAGISMGLSQISALSGSGVAASVARGVLSNVATQGVALATGLQSRFDWTGVAVAGATAGVSSWAGARLPGAAQAGTATAEASAATFANQLGSSMASVLAGAGARSLIDGTSFGDNVLAALPSVIGATIGNMLASRMAGMGRAAGGSGGAGGGGSDVEAMWQRDAASTGANGNSATGSAGGRNLSAGADLLAYEHVASGNAVSGFDGNGELVIMAKERYRPAPYGGGGYDFGAFSWVGAAVPALTGGSSDWRADRSFSFAGRDFLSRGAARQAGTQVIGSPRPFSGLTFKQREMIQAAKTGGFIESVAVTLAESRGANFSTIMAQGQIGAGADGLLLVAGGMRGVGKPYLGNQLDMTVINGENGVHANSRLSGRTTYLYELQTRGGEFLKYGISVNPDTRYSKSFMADKRIFRITSGSRADMLDVERQMVISNPGPLNNEPWAVNTRKGK
ncbi:MAG TPA: hypothetical protein VFQ57_02280, partial [Sphingomonas sp.]|nr:hypothetical protein [Sphingomonas sp.]